MEQCFLTFCRASNPREHLDLFLRNPLALKYEIFNFSSKYQHHVTFIASKYNIAPPMTVLPYFKNLLDFEKLGTKNVLFKLEYQTGFFHDE